MVQKESQAALEERESERNANPASASGASLEPSAAPAPGEDNPSGAGAAAVAGAAGRARRFLCGVVEGFYGRPWVMEQRKELFRRLQKWELNTYLYAPKDDYKHRMFWREMYSVEEAGNLLCVCACVRACVHVCACLHLPEFAHLCRFEFGVSFLFLTEGFRD